MEPIRVTYTIGETEYLQLTRRQFARSRAVWIISALLLLYLVFMAYRLHDAGRTVLLMAMMILTAIAIMLRIRYRIRKAYRSNKSFQQVQTVTFATEKVQIENTITQGEFTWNSLHRVEEWPDWWLFFRSTNMMTPVPKRAFNDRADIDRLRAMITATPGLPFKHT